MSGPKMQLVCVILILLSSPAFTQKEGQQCVDGYTNTVGRCTSANRCQSAREDFQRNGIRPTFCEYSAEGPTVCCRDGSSILQTPAPSNDGSVWETSNRGPSRKRVSQRKCDLYSRSVTQTVDIVPLLPEPDLISISTAKCSYVGIELIVGGQSAELAEFPHMAAIGWLNYDNGYSFNCGGTLISPRWVMTAGHCTRDPRMKDPSPAIVRLGDHNLNPSVDDGARPVDVQITSIKAHPEYKPPKRYNDIALLKLATNVEFSNEIRAACLWQHEQIDQPKAIATGWGVTDPYKPQNSDELQKVSLTLLENSYCDQLLASGRNRNWAGFAPTQLCAGELRGGKDTCQGDSGAPLQIATKENQCIFQIVGITSFGQKCAQSGKPAIYTRVSAYIDWIESVVWPGEV